MLATDSIPETARYYVYTLAYPDGTVFYVGKGTGARMDAHEKEAKGGYTSKKCDIIRQIWAQGGQVMKTKVYQTESASDALQYEHDLILAYGLDSLANVKVEKGK